METQDNTQKKTIAEQVVGIMGDAGIRNLYAITGDSLNGINDAVRRDGRIRWIHMRHEESGAFAASAEAQVTGRLAACAGSSGPGHVHLINGLYDAQRSNAPVLALASMSVSPMQGTGYFQETDPIKLFSDCSVYDQVAMTADQAPRMLQGAMQAAVGLGGVGVFALPGDIASQTASSPQASVLPLYTQDVPEPDMDKVKEAAGVLNKASKVAIYVGSGAKNAHDTLMKVAALLNAPVGTTFKSRMENAYDCPNFAGHLAYLGMWSMIQALADADAILIIGSNFPYPGFFPEGTKTIQVDVRPERLGRRADVSVGVRADAGKFLDALLPMLKQKEDRTFLDKTLADYNLIQTKLAEPIRDKGTKGSIRPEYLTAEIDRQASNNAIFTIDTGMNCLWAAHYLTPKKGRTMIGSFQHGSMANAMPMAIGASLAAPDRQVISLSGDGGISMLLGDLMTISQYNLPVKVVVYDNRALAFVKAEMEMAGIEPWQVNMDNPDFADVAKTMGFQAETIDDPAEVPASVGRLLQAKGPALLSVKTYTDAGSWTFDEAMMHKASPDNRLENFRMPGE